MNKIITILFCILFTSILSAQQYEEVVYLKNGSVVRGTIIEQIPNVSLKIQTKDGNIFFYKMEEVERTTKELVQSNVSPQSKYTDEEKIKLIDKQIEEAESAKTVGIWMVVGGVAAQVAGWATYSTEVTSSGSIFSSDYSYEQADNTLTWVLVGVGAVVSIWGAYKWIAGANEAALLKSKRFDITFSPSVIPIPNRDLAYGVAMKIVF